MTRHIVVLTHDVDWGFHGPPFEHVLARLSRFSPGDRWAFLAYRENIYNGFDVILESEERVYTKSTFLFRPYYDDGGIIDEYSVVINDLVRNGWEVGLHSNNASSIESIAREKQAVEYSCGCRVVSHRPHYLRIDERLIPKLADIGIIVDSSLCFTRDAPRSDTPGYILMGKVIELPITIMDAYMFTYWGVKSEEEVVTTVKRIILERISRGERVSTILWHVNSVRMYGGRAYTRILEELHSIDDVIFARMIDVPALLGVGGADGVHSSSDCSD